MNQTSAMTAESIKEWVIDALAAELDVDPGKIDINTPFQRFGVDSVTAVNLSGKLEKWLDRDLDPTLLFHYTTINALGDHLATLVSPAP